MYGHRCLENIKKLYTSAGKCDFQQYYKAIIVAEMVPNPNIFTDNSPMSPGTSVTVKKTSARKSLLLFTEVLDVKNETDFHWLGDAK